MKKQITSAEWDYLEAYDFRGYFVVLTRFNQLLVAYIANGTLYFEVPKNTGKPLVIDLLNHEVLGYL